MKKILLSLAFATFGLTAGSYAQTIMSQNFESPTVIPAIPATWSQHSTGTTPWHTAVAGTTGSGNTWGSLTGAYDVPSHTQYVIVDDNADPTQLHDTLKSPVFDMSSYTPANVWLTFDYFFYNATYTSTGITETAYVLGSSNGGSTWAIIDTIPGDAWNDGGDWATTHVSLGALSGANCKIAFVYSDNGGTILGCALDNIVVNVPPASDISLTSVYPPTSPYYFFQTGVGTSVGGTMYNNGGTTITSFDATYQVGAGSPVTCTFSGLSVAPFTSYNFTCTTPYVVTSGAQTLNMWVTEAGDPNLSNDSGSTVLNGIATVKPKLVMIEEFNQASCDPCAEATPNLDSVYVNNISNSIMVRYHVNFPGRDCMDSVTLSPFVNAMISYYGVSGVPDAQLDGAYIYPGAGYFTSQAIQSELAQNSPFDITVSTSLDIATHTYSFSATITGYTTFAAGLSAHAALTIDTLTYAANQSTESIPQYVFPEVCENMFPNSAGTSLAAFTAGSSQTITGSWAKNHPWASDYSVWHYDSTSTGKIVVWVIDNATKHVYQAGFAPVSVLTTGVNAVTSESGSMDVYPNPASNVATVALNLKTAADVKMEVYNMAGQVVYSMPVESRNAGSSISNINTSNFANGNYVIRVSIGNEVLNKNLTITK